MNTQYLPRAIAALTKQTSRRKIGKTLKYKKSDSEKKFKKSLSYEKALEELMTQDMNGTFVSNQCIHQVLWSKLDLDHTLYPTSYLILSIWPLQIHKKCKAFLQVKLANI